MKKIKSKLSNNKFRATAFTCYFLLSTLICPAQDSIVVSGQFIDNTKYAQVLMKKFGVGSSSIAGAAIKGESFSITVPPDIEPGVYRFVYAIAAGEQYIDIIMNGKEKEIAFTLKANDENAAPLFNSSIENQKWYAYIAQSNAQFLKIDLLNQFIYAYPNSESAIVKAAMKEWQHEKEQYETNFNTFKNEMQGTWAYEMIVNRPYYFANPTDDPRIRDYEKREHFWDGFSANNPLLLNTPLYTEHILNYLRYWMNPNMNFSVEEQTNGFKRAVDVIIRQFAGNEQTHEFVYKYLTLGFKEIGEEEVLQYLDENYKDLANRCFDYFEKTEFDKRMQGYAAMKPGNLAPDFEINRVSQPALSRIKKGVNSMFKLKSEQTLIVFWSSSCPHCMEEMPKLNEWVTSRKDMQVVAVSLDVDSTSHYASIKQFPNMVHSCDLKGWNTEAATKYYIAATPTYILLDKRKNILGKYSDLNKIIGK